MKNRPTMENAESVRKPASGQGISRDKQDGDDTEDDEDEDRDEPVTVATTIADTCSASHEFEWLSPGSQGIAYSHLDKQNEKSIYADVISERQQPVAVEEPGVNSCQVSPARSVQNRQFKQTSHVWPRRFADVGDHIRMSSPSPCHELHGCRRHTSPMRSTWCCPSPSTHALCLQHHGGSVITGLELVPYNRDYYGSDLSFWPCQSCACLPPTGVSQSRCQDSHIWCHNASPHHEIFPRESSPCAVHRPCQNLGGSRRSRCTNSRRDCSPSTLSPRYSPVHVEQTPSARHSGHEQWQMPVHSDDISNLQKVQELESDKKNLILQASVLADQVEAQADKIIELERILDQKKDELNHLEQNLHQEMLAHSAVENTKLQLMSELSNLRLRLTAAERDRKESDEKCRKLENQLALLQARLFEQEPDHSCLKDKFSWNNSYVLHNETSEIEKLRSTLDSVMVTSDEKDQKIEDLHFSLTKYKKLQDLVLSSHLHKTDSSGKESQTFDSDSILSSITNNALKKLPSDANSSKASPFPVALASTSSIHTHFEHSSQPHCSLTATKSISSACSTSAFHKSNSVENMCPSSVMAVSSKNQFGTMPRQAGSQVLQQLQMNLQEYQTHAKGDFETTSVIEKSEVSAGDSGIKLDPKSSRSPDGSVKSSGVTFGKGFFKLRSGKRSSSEPHLAAQECITIPSGGNQNGGFTSQSCAVKLEKDKNKGFLKFFSKWKRSGSQNIERFEGDFKRGGNRATAGPRLGWSHDIKIDPDIPFNRWSTDMIVEWLHKLGLSMYISECRRWMCNGETLMKAHAHDLEKELNMKHPLHKKKLMLAIKSMSSSVLNLPSSINNLDYLWVVRWLDDIGLPQYKDSFSEARVDGRVLHCLTVEDLLFLKVTNQLHHISIKCGIQILREKGFDPHCLIRRSLPDEGKIYTPEMVALWSNHRVMEWLRTVDLSEYAPNLRGSGVHGALVVFEPKFNANLFATLLNIPPTKTLLRRHLATHFKHIVGEELMQIKREKETEMPLSPSVKIKVVRKPQFALKKKRNKSDFENEDYVCPIDISVYTEVPKVSDGEKLIVRRNSDPSPQDQRHLDIKEGTTERIGAVSKEISTLTTMLQHETLSEAPSTVV